ncbi:MAG: hypothetical protein K8953_06775 [Proteobacteria bacterium]|nr:hypothetical protein [Pseudomonadota bacterium]
MMDKKKIKDELEALRADGQNIYTASYLKYNKNAFNHHDEETEKNLKESTKEINDPQRDYYIWYYKACKVLHILDSHKLKDFQDFYTNYTEDWIIDQTEDFFSSFEKGFRIQNYILLAVDKNFDSTFFNLERDIHYGIYESEIDIARELQEQGYFRAAGAIAGVVLEIHLKKVASNNGIKIKDKATMSDYNNALKSAGVYSKILSSQIKTCTDIRNKCVHPDKDEPTPADISTIIHNAEIVIASVN